MKTKCFINIILMMTLFGMIFDSGYAQDPSTIEVKPVELSDVKTKKPSFEQFYSLTPLNFSLQALSYKLPLETKKIDNFDDLSAKIPLNFDALKLLQKNGFVVITNPFNAKEDDITEPYDILQNKEIPIFVTSDSLLHLYHIQFDETLRQIEEKEFYDDIWMISKYLLADSIEKYNNSTGDLKEAARRNVVYFAVGLSLLRPRDDQLCKDAEQCQDPSIACTFFSKKDLKKYAFLVPDFVKGDVQKELSLIEKHKGFSNSPVFIYKEDYSQYVPRGHYTRSAKLKNYFKAFMWYGRISMLLKGTDQVEQGKPCDMPLCAALISLYDAKIQTMQSFLITHEFAKNNELKNKWDRIYLVTAFYVGVSDDLGPYEYIEALNFVFDKKFNPNNLTEENIGRVKAKLAEYMPPKIYGGTGNIGLLPPFTPEQLDEILEMTKGFKLMGQRFVPDSYMFSNLVSPFVGMYAGQNCAQTFTCKYTEAGPGRCFPRGLDVMALLGSNRAKELLEKLGDTKYKGNDKNGNIVTYETQFNKLKDEFDSFNELDWQKNLYWSWLYALKPLLKEFKDGYPTFMQTTAWQDNKLTTALASWTELRHDTILYAKQSYTPVLRGILPSEKPVIGYIEPVPEFYNRLMALTKMTTKGLGKMNVLDSSSKLRLENLEKVLKRLKELSIKELKNEELTSEDYNFIKDFGDYLNDIIPDVNETAKKTTIVADVHTDQNPPEQVLEEGVGYVKLIVAAYKVPDGRILIGAGPVMTYYEFKQPIKDRLTDDKWQELLDSNPPKQPEWIGSFSK